MNQKETRNVKAKKVKESRTTMTEMVMPNDTNPLGNLMGGNLMRWMDIVGSICAAKHSESYVVTVSVDHVSFKRPIHVGDVVTLNANITRSFNTSMEVYVEVFASDIKGGNPRKCNHAYLTFVAMSDDHKPIPVPEVIALTTEQEKLYDGAARRRELRLILGNKIPAKDAKLLKEYLLSQ